MMNLINSDSSSLRRPVNNIDIVYLGHQIPGNHIADNS